VTLHFFEKRPGFVHFTGSHATINKRVKGDIVLWNLVFQYFLVHFKGNSLFFLNCAAFQNSVVGDSIWL
jgi:hypothetical protein